MRRVLILLAALALTGCATTQNFVEKSAITKANSAFPQFTASTATVQETVDHSAFDDFLSAYVVQTQHAASGSGAINLVRYADVTPEDYKVLSDYVSGLQAVKVSALSREEQLAFWINLYNAETIRVILENYPVKSIRDIKSHPLDFKGPWNDTRLTVEGTDLTLDNIENLIVRPVFDDPRIHYALNCAAIGCPNLRERAFTGAGLNAALDTQSRRFINDPRGVKVKNGNVTASRIFLWYDVDYGDGEADVLGHIRQYAEPDLLNALEGKTSIDHYAYDWSLNEASGAKN